MSEQQLPADANPPHMIACEPHSDSPSTPQDLDSILATPIAALPDTALPRSVTEKHKQALLSGIKREDIVADHSVVANAGRRLPKLREQLSMAQVEAAWAERMITFGGRAT